MNSCNFKILKNDLSNAPKYYPLENFFSRPFDLYIVGNNPDSFTVSDMRFELQCREEQLKFWYNKISLVKKRNFKFISPAAWMELVHKVSKNNDTEVVGKFVDENLDFYDSSQKYVFLNPSSKYAFIVPSMMTFFTGDGSLNVYKTNSEHQSRNNIQVVDLGI
ncbi:hypothetical protein HMI55_004436 [Coelomomyces lativittatus]|nr:hypothetical protein HMI55_004436 [Coelomomyces lativittatus]